MQKEILNVVNEIFKNMWKICKTKYFGTNLILILKLIFYDKV